MVSEAFKRSAVADSRIFGTQAAARMQNVGRKAHRAWRREENRRLAQPTAEELALLERDDLGPKDLPARTRIRSRAFVYALTGEIDPANIPPEARR
jgi:hypothetical protein